MEVMRGVYLRKITRSMVEIPILPRTEILRGDVITITGSRKHVEAAIKELGYADRPVDSTDIAFLGVIHEDPLSIWPADELDHRSQRWRSCRPKG